MRTRTSLQPTLLSPFVESKHDLRENGHQTALPCRLGEAFSAQIYLKVEVPQLLELLQDVWCRPVRSRHVMLGLNLHADAHF